MKRMESIEARLATLAAVAVAAVAAVAATAVVSVSGVANDGARLASAQSVLSLQQDADMMHDALRSDVLASVPMDGKPVPATAATARDAEQLRNGLLANAAQLASLDDPALTKQYDQTKADLDAYASAASNLVALAAKDPTAAQRMLSDFNTRFELARREMAALTIQLRAEADQEHTASLRTARQGKLRTTGIGVLTCFLLLVLAGAVRRSVRASLTEKAAAEAEVRRANDQLTADAVRERFDGTLNEAFEMALTEEEAYAVVRRAVVEVAPGHRAELLLADNSQAHLSLAMAQPELDPPGCGVLSPNSCIAVRRGRPAVFDSPDGIGSCPKLAGRVGEVGQAACSPVTFLGEGLGVLHVVTAPGDRLEPDVLRALEVTADQAGNRMGTLRAFGRSQLQASTDGLTGLLNRRTVEERIGQLQREGRTLAVALCDLDHFKNINDTFGHEAGDRALRVFSATLRSVMRTDDLVARYGGEEFLLVMPDCGMRAAAEVLGRIRTELALSLQGGGGPTFTASFGLTLLGSEQPLDEGVRVADLALMRAKTEGRDRVVTADAPLAPSSV
jgi:diguanylate cyclase (GGDEF)-like protein